MTWRDRVEPVASPWVPPGGQKENGLRERGRGTSPLRLRILKDVKLSRKVKKGQTDTEEVSQAKAFEYKARKAVVRNKQRKVACRGRTKDSLWRVGNSCLTPLLEQWR